MSIQLSILTTTIITRWDKTEKLAFKIMKQLEEKNHEYEVEHLVFHDAALTAAPESVRV